MVKYFDANFVFSNTDLIKVRKTNRNKFTPNRAFEINSKEITCSTPNLLFEVPLLKFEDSYKAFGIHVEDNSHNPSCQRGIIEKNYYNFCFYALLSENLFSLIPLFPFRSLVLNSKIDFNGIHGFNHWNGVYNFGRQLSWRVDKKVLLLFSVLHDFFRAKDSLEPSHGNNALPYLPLIYKELDKFGRKYALSTKQQDMLTFAIKNHDLEPELYDCIEDPLSRNRTVRICLDADKLDLGRVGIKPHKYYLLSREAKMYLKRI